MAKYIFAQYYDLNLITNWAYELYYEHLKILNNCAGDPGKESIDDYINSFIEILSSIKKGVFVPEKSIIKICDQTFVDGEHRIAACLFYGKKVYIEKVPNVMSTDLYSSYFFKRAGLQEKYIDAMAIEYAKCKKNTFIVALFPAANIEMIQVHEQLLNFGRIVYEKQIQLTSIGQVNLIKHLYEDDNTANYWSFDFSGANHKASLCFPEGKKEISIFLWECDSLENARKCKLNIRALSVAGQDAIHINDTHDQTVLHANILFNNNSIHFLNYAHPKYFDNFVKLISWYKNWLKQNNFPEERFCIDGSAVMAAYGLRDCQDLDFLHHKYDYLMESSPHTLINSHNFPSDLCYHSTTKDDIIFNPNNYFYYKGLKFVSLNEIKKLKLNRNEEKDKKDLELISTIPHI